MRSSLGLTFRSPSAVTALSLLGAATLWTTVAAAGQAARPGVPYQGPSVTLLIQPASGTATDRPGNMTFAVTSNADTISVSPVTYEGSSQNWAGPLVVTRQSDEHWTIVFDFSECKAPVRTRKLSFIVKASKANAPVMQKAAQFTQTGPPQ